MYLPLDHEQKYNFRAPELSQISIIIKTQSENDKDNDKDNELIEGGIEIFLWRFDNSKMFLRHPKKKKMVFSVRNLKLDSRFNKMQGKCILYKKNKKEENEEVTSGARYCLTFFYNEEKEKTPVFLSKPPSEVLDVQFKHSKNRIVVVVKTSQCVARYDKKKRRFWISETESVPYRGGECFRMRHQSLWFISQNPNANGNNVVPLRPLQLY